MPIYEYRCSKGHTFEAMQRISEAPLETCETCGAPAVRVLHAPAVHFKGSGFYNTDYGTRKRAKEKAAESKGAEAKKSDGGAEAKKPGGDAPAKKAEKSSAS